MPRPASQPVTPATTPRQELGRARLLVGAAVAAVGLFVALHWIVLPGSALSLDQKSRRTESVAALEQSGQAAGSRRNAAANRVSDVARYDRLLRTKLEPFACKTCESV